MSKAKLSGERPSKMVLSEQMVDVLDRTIHGLRKLDDTEGADKDNLNFAQRHFDLLSQYLTLCRFGTEKVFERLIHARAQLSQLCGWMAYDADQHELAWWYLRTGLRAARLAGAVDFASHILGCMSYSAAHRGDAPTALTFAAAARHFAKRAQPMVKALALSRSATACAAAGDLDGCLADVDEAHELYYSVDIESDRPEWLYWFNDMALEVQAGHSLLLYARITKDYSPLQVTEAQYLLERKAVDMATPYQRDATLHGAWLAHSYVHSGDDSRAIATIRSIIDRLPEIRSTRSFNELRTLEPELGVLVDQGNSDASEVRDELRSIMAA